MAIKSGVFLLGAFGNGYSKQGKSLLPMRLHHIVLFLINNTLRLYYRFHSIAGFLFPNNESALVSQFLAQ